MGPVRGRRLATGALALVGLVAVGVPVVGAALDLPRGPASSTLAAEVAETQQRLSAEALATLAARSCPQAPAASTLEGLPDEPLACLGTGPARAPSSGDGHPTVVNLWASWCLPCVEEMPLLQRTAERAGAGARFVGVDTEDTRDSAAALLEATGVGYEQYDDPQAVVRDALRAVGLPVTVVFDARGREVARKVGATDAAWLEQALAEAGVALAPAA